MRLHGIDSLLLRITILVVLFLAIRSGAEACSCIMPGPPCASYWQVDAVFSGKVTAISSVVSAPAEDSQSPWPRMRRVTLAIESAFRGVEGRSVELLTGQGGGDCGYNFVSGERYLVYAHRSDRGLVATICSRTRLMKDAAEDLAYIQNLPPVGSGATIKGRVIQQSVRFESAEAQARIRKPMVDTVVRIAGHGISRQERTNSTGDFQFSGLPGGTYKVRVDLPRTSDDSFTEMEVNVVDRGCADIPFSVNQNGRIQGR